MIYLYLLPEDEVAAGEGIMYIVTVVQVEALLTTESVAQTAELDGTGALMAHKRVRSLFARSRCPQLELCRLHAAHL